MTKKEAIETIKMAISQIEWDYPIDYVAAFDKAIDALKQPEIIRCGDCKFAEKQVCGPKEYEYKCVPSEFEGLYNYHDKDWFCADGERRDKDD